MIPQPTADDLARFPEAFWEMLVTDHSELSRDMRRIWIRRAVAAEDRATAAEIELKAAMEALGKWARLGHPILDEIEGRPLGGMGTDPEPFVRRIREMKQADEYKRWHDAVDDALVCAHLPVLSDDPKETLNRLICWHNSVALNPLVSKEAAKLRDTFKAERDELRAEVERLKEIEWRYRELCK